ncbi:MAG: M3 family oligoendopeptidase, partial [Acidobacteriota bacterium]
MTKTTRLGELRQETWDLSGLLPDASEATLSSRLSDLEIAVETFESWRGKLSSDLEPELLVELLEEYEALVTKLIVLGYYGSLWFASDTQSQEALDYRNRIEQILTGVENRMLFFTLWWKQLDDAAAERLLPAQAEHPDYRHFLADLRRFKPFALDEQREQIINLKDADGQDALLTIYSMLTNRLEFRIEVDGEEQILTRDELQGYVHSPDADLRATAYRELYRVFQKEQSILGQIYVHRVRDWYSENVGVRSFPTPISVRNLANDIPDAAVTTLLDVVSENNHVFQRYFRLKAKWLGIAKLSRYDLYAPLTASERRVDYRDAVELVLDTMAAFHPSLAEQAQRVFLDRHIDSEIRKGKKGGAFCATVLPSQTPWLLINFNGRVRDVATLAHELGHAIHSMLAEDHSVLTQHASLPLAETASVFSEMLLTDRLLAEESDPLVRRELLVAAVDDIYATVLRQAYFVRFELAAHDAIRGGGTAEALDELYIQTLESQFGDAVEVPPEFRREWMMIPHIYQTPFYCYSYCFGQLLVLALYQRYKEEGESFVPGYL